MVSASFRRSATANWWVLSPSRRLPEWLSTSVLPRGVLITTSWFGRASHDFARQHGRLQLIEGPELKYLIKEHLGKDVIPGPIPPKRRPSH
ncbi:restriction endonuclease [Streptomyces sp. NPDC059757]|uniref:restriction endonuclease n=1 Tax=Streptomyces sp. NPDC059757 TaxID=3346935 RepID=UPI00365215D4